MGAGEAGETTATPPRSIGTSEVSRPRSLDDVVYNFSELAHEHPGGAKVLLRLAVCDATAVYSEAHSMSLVKTLPHRCPNPPLDSLLNARAVGVGRGSLYALSYGKEGVKHSVDNECSLQFSLDTCEIDLPGKWRFGSQL
ncbi:hypothetical protein GGS23DRAFT_600396 [Durotheca rogersii]|uniref:uncharacterized protein n=1 Tax=Durotheca rogersii TaxID=419775 RepID=UPI002220B865|nr:uncharacterized protein GGS23DRAFT_600396 [Durotheca rogersii]KAI5859472.1 hypothetical protein GGS23DRAFT_600396 [Durotheca rogersii]